MIKNAFKLEKSGFRRPKIGSLTLSLVVGLYLMFFANFTFWAKAHAYLSAYPFAIAGLYVGISAIFIALISFFSVKYIFKPFLAFLIVVAAAASWFMDSFGVIIDSDMVRNAFQTTSAEAGNLITEGFIWHMILLALLPIVFICWVRVRHRLFPQKLIWNTVAIVSCLAVFGIVAFANSKTYTTAIRQHKDLVKSLNPVNPIVGTIHFFTQAGAEAQVVAAPLGLDAKSIPPLAGVTKPRVTIIVAGETARAANFSLNGYGRDTNPELKKRDIVYFPNTTSCGTATATSIPCMFSQFTREDYSHKKGLANENVLDVLSHAGVDVAWWDNNTGSKGVATRVPFEDLVETDDPKFCREGECLDAIFLDKVDTWLDTITKDSVVVIHQMGSHGPTYHMRYTEEFRKFVPDCQTSELGKCKDSEIVNAYDNTVLYTDHFLATLIDKLKGRSGKLATGLIYASDHGESLGENGIYLHGAPYVLAPADQTHVPFLVWFDEDFSRSMGLDKSCLVKEAGLRAYSHDNFFHSILGMMNIATSVYDTNLDVFGSCKTVRTS
ncbi:phosphoethanolamine transferase [Agrobacterium fabrum]|uniref:phosphoethanolamine transferase n=1 Tax=Agrobacterium fabrum TaxID=1176649 RepID=UPI001FCF1764|nr:phosphoethanolamine--lipid A transferase [Agrobacterium fabrum]WCK79850.1 phosphoethanolamine--lipid A transferase [Agrobacterium fabrum]